MLLDEGESKRVGRRWKEVSVTRENDEKAMSTYCLRGEKIQLILSPIPPVRKSLRLSMLSR